MDESALFCQSHALIPPLECGVCRSAAPPNVKHACSNNSLTTSGPGIRFQHQPALPFDAMRFQYAGAVMAGLAQRSILASGKWERALDALQRLILGPLARVVLSLAWPSN